MVMSTSFQIRIVTMSSSWIKHSLSTRLCVSIIRLMTYDENKIQLIHRLTQTLWSSLTMMTTPILTGMPDSSKYFTLMSSIAITSDHVIQSRHVRMSCLYAGFDVMVTFNRDSMLNDCPGLNFSTRKAYLMHLDFLTQTLSYEGCTLFLDSPMVRHKSCLIPHLFDQRLMELNGSGTGIITMWTCKCTFKDILVSF